MDNKKNAPANNAQAGARACLDALRALEMIANKNEQHDEYQERELMLSALLNAAEQPLSPYMTGFMAVLVEYIDLNLGRNNRFAQRWTPEATLSLCEAEAIRKQSYAAVSA